MSAPIPLRRDFDASQLRSLAWRTNDGPQARRLLALAAICDPSIHLAGRSRIQLRHLERRTVVPLVRAY
jgi:hypothetical protein